MGAVTDNLTHGTGLTDINEFVYGQNAVHHMIPWTSVRVDRCLNHSVVSDLFEDNPEFGSLVDQAGKMYTSLMANEMTVESALTTNRDLST